MREATTLFLASPIDDGEIVKDNQLKLSTMRSLENSMAESAHGEPNLLGGPAMQARGVQAIGANPLDAKHTFPSVSKARLAAMFRFDVHGKDSTAIRSDRARRGTLGSGVI